MNRRLKNKISGIVILIFTACGGLSVFAQTVNSPEATVKSFTEAAEKGDVETLAACCTGKMSTVIQRFIKAKQLKQYTGYKIVNTVVGKDKFNGKAIVNCNAKRFNSNATVKIALLLVKNNDKWLIEDQKSMRHYQRFEDYYPNPNISLFKELSIVLLFYARSHDGAYPKTLNEIKGKMTPGKEIVWTDPDSGEKLPLKYFSGYNEDKDYSKILVAAPKAYKGKRRCIIVGDMQARLLSEKEFQELLKKSK